MIAVVDYGAGNLRSVAKAVEAAGGDVLVTDDPADVARADRIVLPGVGAFAHCIGSLKAVPGLVEALQRRVVEQGVPFLGVCVGMQLLADRGTEHGVTEGLGWIGGDVVRIAPGGAGLKVPHIGWTEVAPAAPHAVVGAGTAYFVHSYRFAPSDEATLVARCDYGGAFAAAVGRDNILGVQFHPEKSQAYGLATLRAFLEWRP